MQWSGKVPYEMGGMRLDAALAKLVEGVSRARLKTAIESGNVLMDEEVILVPRHILIGGEWLEVEWQEREELTYIPQDIPLEVVYEDEGLMVINKPAGLVVHPGAGNQDGTLLNGLLHHYPLLNKLPRAGIVHRLDKLTSGLLVVAKQPEVQDALTDMLKEHEIERLYDAVAVGQLVAGGSVEAGIGRHSSDRTKMMVDDYRGREAVTHYRVLDRFRAHTHIRCQLETGRTHQIRVHLSHIGYPLFGDPEYGRRLSLPKGMIPEHAEVLRAFKRQALHASELSFIHPLSDEEIRCVAPLPTDMQSLLQVLTEDSKEYQDDFS
jgi:23S rRNA pseudouridine1911/1915/1917 synthase